jgi:molybdate transport system substrate-binding protein
MKSRILALLFSLLIAASSSAAELTVHAAASLTEAMQEIGAAYEKESSDKLQFNFGASSMLARQIEEGAPADLFFSADEAKMDALEKKGLLLPGTRRSLLSNLLVIVVPADASSAPKSAADLARPEFKKVALAEPQTRASWYLRARVPAKARALGCGKRESCANRERPRDACGRRIG